MEVIRRVEVRAVVRREVDVLDRPAGAVGKVFLLQSGKEAGDLARRVGMLVVLDLRAKRRGIGDHVVLEIDRQVDEATGHCSGTVQRIQDRLGEPRAAITVLRGKLVVGLQVGR